jgi:predicted outer membrane protein
MYKRARLRLVLFGIGSFIFSGEVLSVLAGQQGADPGSFTERVIEMNRAAIQFGRIAMTRARGQRVVDFADVLIRTHELSLHRLKGIESTEADNLTPEHQKVKDAFSSSADSKFDAEFVAVMVHEEQRVIRLLEQEAGITREGQTGVRHRTPAIPGSMAEVARELLPAQEQLLSKAEDIRRQLESTSQVREAIER